MLYFFILIILSKNAHLPAAEQYAKCLILDAKQTPMLHTYTKSLFALVLIQSFIACNYVPDTQTENYNPQEDAIKNILSKPEVPENEPKKLLTGLRETHHESGKVKTAIYYKDGVQHGEAKEYYPDGTLAKAVNYIDGELQGEAMMYDRQGRITKKMHYSHGKKNGVQTRYFKSGKAKSEMSYTLDIPNNDLWEKDVRGNINKDFGKLVFRVERATNSEDLFFIRVNMEPKVFKYHCYAFPSTIEHGDGIKRDNLISKNMAQHSISVKVPKGQRLQGGVNVVAIYETAMRNEAVVYGTYNFDITN